MPDLRSYFRCKRCGKIFAYDASVPTEQRVSQEEAVAAVLAGTPRSDRLCFSCETDFCDSDFPEGRDEVLL